MKHRPITATHCDGGCGRLVSIECHEHEYTLELPNFRKVIRYFCDVCAQKVLELFPLPPNGHAIERVDDPSTLP